MKTINETNYVEKAEFAIKKHLEKNTKSNGRIEMVTTSKIRNLLAMSADIYNNVLALQEENLTQDLIGRIEYLRMRFVYECGRDKEKKVKSFVTESSLLNVLKEIGGSRNNYLLFYHYFEALVAFHKFYGGQD